MKRFFTIFTARRCAVLAAAIALGATSCDQSAIFNSISSETQKADALVQGTPSRIVKVGNDLFVANGYLWKRDATPANNGSGTWSKATRPADSSGELKVRNIATDGTNLYAYTVADTNTISEDTVETAVWESADGGTSWSSSALTNNTGYRIYTIYTANGELFAGGRKDSTSTTYESEYALLRYDGTEFVSLLDGLTDGGQFTGAAYDGTNYYFAMSELGIYKTSTLTALSSSNIASGTSGYTITGITAVGQSLTKSVVAVGGYYDSDNILFSNQGAAFTDTGTSSAYFTGAIAEYDTGTSGVADGVPDYLLIGYKYGTTYGYREIALASGELTGISLSKPSSDSSVNDYDQYASSLGVVPVNHLYQSWEGTANILYASAQVEGLWSTVDKGDWNLVSQ